MKTNVAKDEFMAMSHEEQSYLIYGAVEGHEKRITKLENQKWLKSSLALVGGIIGGIGAKLGLG